METIRPAGSHVINEKDGTFTVFCEDCALFFGMGDTVDEAVADLRETLRITKEEIGKGRDMPWMRPDQDAWDGTFIVSVFTP